MKKSFKIFIIVLSFFFACKEEPAQGDGGEVNNVNTENEINKEKILQLVNKVRSEGCNCGDKYYPPVDPLVWNNLLEEAAINHTKDMIEHNNFSHTGSDGSSPGDRISRVSYNWSTYGENIAGGHKDEDAVMVAWLGSVGHCKNIMNGKFKEIGVARIDDFWTQVFACQK